ncbi:MAG: 50S ribosomal protein L11 methyltransferase [Christensenellales bacterium]|jgi:ribosomal protein L11 methyltransferase
MDYLQATVVTTHEAADAVSELLMRCGAHGTQIIDRSDIPDAQQIADTWALMDESVFDYMPADVWVRAWFSSPTHIENVRAMLLTLPDALAFDAGALTLTVDNVREEDWAESWKQYYKPLRIGKNLVVKPGWEAYQPQPGDKVIELDPGMAFGTGTHETTRLCMELMEQWYEGGDVLDVGTGSGILAVTGALLGAPRVLAVDIDPVAVRVAQENVGINGLNDRIQVRQGDLVNDLGGTFGLACANILADVIIALIPQVKQHLAPGAVFVCSGIILEREDDVLHALARAGFALLEARHLGAWTALAARKGEG